MINVLVIAFGLAMDSFGVSVALGSSVSKKRVLSLGVVASGVFAIFHIGMLTMGFLFGETFGLYISGVDHWISFVLLTLVGVRMIQGSSKNGKSFGSDDITLKLLVSLALATSIDALIIGAGIAFMKVPIFMTVIAVGIVVFLLSQAGFYLGIGGNGLLHKKAGIAGGFILVFMGIKILLEHIAL